MWISCRAATRILAGVVSGDAQARAVLAAGLAGPPLLDARAPLYDEATIPELPALTAGLLAARIQGHGRLPWVATLCGFVAVGGDITGTRPEGHPPGRAFVLEPPGSWFATLEGARLPSGPGGRPWLVWLPPPQ